MGAAQMHKNLTNVNELFKAVSVLKTVMYFNHVT